MACLVVLRHGERADAVSMNGLKSSDPSLSDVGRREIPAAAEKLMTMIRRVGGAAEFSGDITLITSPFKHCCETANTMRDSAAFETLLPTDIVLDRALGEVFNEAVVGSSQPPPLNDHDWLRPSETSLVPAPQWGETHEEACKRYKAIFQAHCTIAGALEHTRILITHGDALSAVMESLYPDRKLYKTDYLAALVLVPSTAAETVADEFSSGGMSLMSEQRWVLAESTGVEWLPADGDAKTPAVRNSSMRKTNGDVADGPVERSPFSYTTPVPTISHPDKQVLAHGSAFAHDFESAANRISTYEFPVSTESVPEDNPPEKKSRAAIFDNLQRLSQEFDEKERFTKKAGNGVVSTFEVVPETSSHRSTPIDVSDPSQRTLDVHTNDQALQQRVSHTAASAINQQITPRSNEDTFAKKESSSPSPPLPFADGRQRTATVSSASEPQLSPEFTVESEQRVSPENILPAALIEDISNHDVDSVTFFSNPSTARTGALSGSPATARARSQQGQFLSNGQSTSTATLGRTQQVERDASSHAPPSADRTNAPSPCENLSHPTSLSPIKVEHTSSVVEHSDREYSQSATLTSLIQKYTKNDPSRNSSHVETGLTKKPFVPPLRKKLRGTLTSSETPISQTARSYGTVSDLTTPAPSARSSRQNNFMEPIERRRGRRTSPQPMHQLNSGNIAGAPKHRSTRRNSAPVKPQEGTLCRNKSRASTPQDQEAFLRRMQADVDKRRTSSSKREEMKQKQLEQERAPRTPSKKKNPSGWLDLQSGPTRGVEKEHSVWHYLYLQGQALAKQRQQRHEEALRKREAEETAAAVVKEPNDRYSLRNCEPDKRVVIAKKIAQALREPLDSPAAAALRPAPVRKASPKRIEEHIQWLSAGRSSTHDSGSRTLSKSADRCAQECTFQPKINKKNGVVATPSRAPSPADAAERLYRDSFRRSKKLNEQCSAKIQQEAEKLVNDKLRADHHFRRRMQLNPSSLRQYKESVVQNLLSSTSSGSSGTNTPGQRRGSASGSRDASPRTRWNI